MLWFANIYPQERHRIWISAGFFVMGICLEFLQRLSASRTFMFSDMIVNGFGVVVGWTLAKAFLLTCLLKLDAWLLHTAQRFKTL
jgi:glycopeptide antibiotics resistance protein